QQNLEAGYLDRGKDEPHELFLRTTGRLIGDEDFSDLVLKVGEGGSIVRLKDVGRVERMADETQFVQAHGHPAVIIMIHSLTGASRKEASDGIRAKLEQLSARMPQGLQLDVIFDGSEKLPEQSCLLIDLDLPAGASKARVHKKVLECDQQVRNL